jgi:hypothetical protein
MRSGDDCELKVFLALFPQIRTDLRCFSPAPRLHQPSLKLRLVSRSFSEGWWRWRESNPRPTIFDQLRLHAY